MRALGLDLGEARIGVAISDSAGTVATPLEVVRRSGRTEADHRAIARLVDEWEIEEVVVGLPVSLDGSIGPAARRALAEVEQLERRLSVPVATYDERLTTSQAHRQLAASEVNERDRRKVVDMVAAAIVLQAWLDRRISETRQDGE